MAFCNRHVQYAMSSCSRLLAPPHNELGQNHGCTISVSTSTAFDQIIFAWHVIAWPYVAFISSQMLWIQGIRHPPPASCNAVRSCTLPIYGLKMTTMLPLRSVMVHTLCPVALCFLMLSSGLSAQNSKLRTSRWSRRGVEDEGWRSSGTGGVASAWLRALMRVHMVLLGVLLPATKSGLGSFPSSWITLIGETPMHHESLKAYSEYVEKLGVKVICADQW